MEISTHYLIGREYVHNVTYYSIERKCIDDVTCNSIEGNVFTM